MVVWLLKFSAQLLKSLFLRRGACLFLVPPAINCLILTSVEACFILKSSTISENGLDDSY